MTCPPDVAIILLQIVQLGVLQARAAGWSDSAAGAAAAADHVHNLPGLLIDYSPHGLEHYWIVERRAFLVHCPPDWVHSFEPYWDRLKKYVERLNVPATAQ